MFPPKQAQLFKCTQSDDASTFSPRAPQWCAWGVCTGVMPLYLCRERVKVPSPLVKALTTGAAHKKGAAHLLRPTAMRWAFGGDDAAATSLRMHSHTSTCSSTTAPLVKSKPYTHTRLVADGAIRQCAVGQSPLSIGAASQGAGTGRGQHH